MDVPIKRGSIMNCSNLITHSTAAFLRSGKGINLPNFNNTGENGKFDSF